MLKHCTKFWLLGLLLIVAATYAKYPKVVVSDSAKSIIVKKSNPVFEIVLQSNPTTGYSWLLKNYDSNLIIPVAHKFFSPENKKLAGAPGYEKWVFQVKPTGFVVPQLTSISLIYMRPWEEQGAQVFNFKVVTTLN